MRKNNLREKKRYINKVREAEEHLVQEYGRSGEGLEGNWQKQMTKASYKGYFFSLQHIENRVVGGTLPQQETTCTTFIHLSRHD